MFGPFKESKPKEPTLGLRFAFSAVPIQVVSDRQKTLQIGPATQGTVTEVNRFPGDCGWMTGQPSLIE
jgi:hypothetical protein